MNVLERAKASGRCPPSLFCGVDKDFEAAASKVLDPNGTSFVRLSSALLRTVAQSHHRLLVQSFVWHQGLKWLGISRHYYR